MEVRNNDFEGVRSVKQRVTQTNNVNPNKSDEELFKLLQIKWPLIILILLL